MTSETSKNSSWSQTIFDDSLQEVNDSEWQWPMEHDHDEANPASPERQRESTIGSGAVTDGVQFVAEGESAAGNVKHNGIGSENHLSGRPETMDRFADPDGRSSATDTGHMESTATDGLTSGIWGSGVFDQSEDTGSSVSNEEAVTWEIGLLLRTLIGILFVVIGVVTSLETSLVFAWLRNVVLTPQVLNVIGVFTISVGTVVLFFSKGTLDRSEQHQEVL